MAEHRRGDKIGGSGFSLRRGPDIGLLWCKLQLPVPAPWPPVSFRQTPWPCHPRTHPWTEYQGGGVVDWGAFETLEEKTSFPVLLALACREPRQGVPAQGSRSCPRPLHPAGWSPWRRRSSSPLPRAPVPDFRGSCGRREGAAEWAWGFEWESRLCGPAPRSSQPGPARWGGGVCWLVGDQVPFWGAFQTLDRVSELEPQESVTHHPSTLEVAPVPRTPKNPSSAEPSKLSRSVLLGETRKKKGDWFRQPRCAREQVAELLSAVRAGTRSLRLCVRCEWGPRKPLCGDLDPGWSWGSHLSEGRGCVGARKSLILGSLAVVGGGSPGGR